MQSRIEELLAESAWVKNLARRLVRDEHLAEDVQQEVLRAAWNEAPELEGKRLRAWLATVTRRLARHRQVREQQRAAVERQAARPETAPPSATERLSLHRLLVDAVESLPEKQREAILLRYFDNKTPRVIARELGESSETVRARLSRGLDSLRKRLDEDANPESPTAGRALWSAAFLQHLGGTDPGLRPTWLAAASVPPMLKVFLPAAALALLVALGFNVRQRTDPANLPIARDVDSSAVLTVEDSSPPALASAAKEERRVLTPSARAGKQAVSIQLHSSDGSALNTPLAFLLSTEGRVTQLPLDDRGRGEVTVADPGAMLFAGAEAHQPAAITLEKKTSEVHLTLPALIDLHGTLLEDGGRPPTAVRWALKMESQALDAPYEIARVLELHSRERTVEVDVRGEFQVSGIPSKALLEITLPDTHVFERNRPPAHPRTQTVTASEAPLVLRTLRKPSLLARVVRGDNGQPVKDAQMSVQGINHFGQLRGEGWDEGSDSEGRLAAPIWLYGEGNDHWAQMSASERRDDLSTYARLKYEIFSAQVDLQPLRGEAEIPADGRIRDLGTLVLPVRSMKRVRVVDESGNPIVGAVVVAGEESASRTDEDGFASVPRAEYEQHGLRALAHGYALRAFAPTESSPRDEEAPPVLTLFPGPELELVVPGQDPRELRLYYTWERTPFETLPDADYPYDFGLFEGLLGLEAMIHLFNHDRQNPLAFATANACFDESGTARLPALRPGAEFFVAVRNAEGFKHPKQRIIAPSTPGVQRIELAYRPEAIEDAPAWTVTGHVNDDVGRPVPDATLKWRHGGHYGVSGTCRTNAKGEFTMRALLYEVGGNLELWVTKEGLFQHYRRWKKEPEPSISLVLERARSFEFTALGESGRPLQIEDLHLPEFVGTPETRLIVEPETVRLGTGHWLLPQIPHAEQTVEFVLGCRRLTRVLEEGVSQETWLFADHGHLELELVDAPEDASRDLVLRALDGLPEAQRELRLSSWSPTHDCDLLPGRYELLDELLDEGQPARRFTVTADETVRLEIPGSP